MKRREFIAGLAGSAAWPMVAQAQQSAMPVIGFLSGQSADDDYKNNTVPFLQGLQETGYVVGKNAAIEYRGAEDHDDRLPALAAELVRRRVVVIATTGTPATLAAKAATTVIPIVFSTGADPVALGLVASLNRPGANLTGIASLTSELKPKELQLLRELVPHAARFGFLADPSFPNTPFVIAELQATARTLGLQLVIVNARTDSDLETAFALFSRQRVGAFLISNSTFFNRRTERLATLAARRSLPAIFPVREYALSGGLMSYGTSLAYLNRQLGIYTGRILRGEKPADLPVEQATKIELTLNLKTAKALGIEFPTALLVRADEVIE
jgi:putative ABC transport system substrate-binding protein